MVRVLPASWRVSEVLHDAGNYFILYNKYRRFQVIVIVLCMFTSAKLEDFGLLALVEAVLEIGSLVLLSIS